MNDVLKTMPEMIMGQALDNKLCILPEYDETIRQKSIPERLIALQDIYQIFIPNKMSREIYSKLYLSLLRSIQKKQSIFAVRQYHENSKMIRQKSYESIIGGSDSFTIIGPSGIGKSSAVSRAINILTEVPVLNLGNTDITLIDQSGVYEPAGGKGKAVPEPKEPLEEVIQKINDLFAGNFSDADRVLIYALHDRLKDDKKLQKVAQTSDPQVFAESIFPKTFDEVAQDSYVEQTEAFTSLFQNKSKYNAIMSALAGMLYREFNRTNL